MAVELALPPLDMSWLESIDFEGGPVVRKVNFDLDGVLVKAPFPGKALADLALRRFTFPQNHGFSRRAS